MAFAELTPRRPVMRADKPAQTHRVWHERHRVALTVGACAVPLYFVWWAVFATGGGDLAGVRALTAVAHGLVGGFGPGVVGRLGRGAHGLGGLNPRLVVLAVAGLFLASLRKADPLDPSLRAQGRPAPTDPAARCGPCGHSWCRGRGPPAAR